MKKLVFFVFIIFILLLSIPTHIIGKHPEQSSQNQEYQVIPDEAIRLRILANSDQQEDQQLKRLVRDRVNEKITKWVEDITDIKEARRLIEKRIPEINQTVAEVIKESGEENDYKVEYGKNISFPAKIYGSYIYPAGEYEAVLITIGEGKGANWWCVLFPPLCFLDFSNGTSAVAAESEENESKEADSKEHKEAEETKDAEVKFFLFEWLGLS
ncbi:stage II sporulation protein R [Virgibacillus salexigens]|uniref:Stage II sporulation protein R n=2 Tax=Virgibacillus TaxID=84406 RepID=A0A024Q7L1_9BACI|nr:MULTISPECIES: stage II sporulation protein R [Virgibacillus]MYL40914.1 stage II sporulation protein R [Virgibacillus massiliensis]GGJ52800.1 stage II sporulation protein R [Virgibacillus kapii]CDQ38287.1 stage II sporulation protein R [Virgibacillus massiliensis]